MARGERKRTRAGPVMRPVKYHTVRRPCRIWRDGSPLSRPTTQHGRQWRTCIRDVLACVFVCAHASLRASQRRRDALRISEGAIFEASGCRVGDLRLLVVAPIITATIAPRSIAISIKAAQAFTRIFWSVRVPPFGDPRRSSYESGRIRSVE